jgi:hypothetical protein
MEVLEFVQSYMEVVWNGWDLLEMDGTNSELLVSGACKT